MNKSLTVWHGHVKILPTRGHFSQHLQKAFPLKRGEFYRISLNVKTQPQDSYIKLRFQMAHNPANCARETPKFDAGLQSNYLPPFGASKTFHFLGSETEEFFFRFCLPPTCCECPAVARLTGQIDGAEYSTTFFVKLDRSRTLPTN